MVRKMIGFEIEAKDDTIQISQETLTGDDHIIVLNVDQIDILCQWLKEERDKLAEQK